MLNCESFESLSSSHPSADLIHSHCPNDTRNVLHRGSETCGDIDVIITRPVEDGKTHAGECLYVDGAALVLRMGPWFVTYRVWIRLCWTGAAKRLWQVCHARGVITDDLVMPDNWNDLELIYRGLCRKDTQSKRRRIGTCIVVSFFFSLWLLMWLVRFSDSAMGSKGRCAIVLYGGCR